MSPDFFDLTREKKQKQQRAHSNAAILSQSAITRTVQYLRLDVYYPFSIKSVMLITIHTGEFCHWYNYNNTVITMNSI